jgi:hypothetical protein
MYIGDAGSREICPGGVGFETSSASGGWGAVLVANSTRPGIHGMSVRVVGVRLGLRVLSKPDDNHGNANWETLLGVWKPDLRWWSSGGGKANLILPFDTGCHFGGRFVLTQADNECTQPLKTLVRMTCEYSFKMRLTIRRQMLYPTELRAHGANSQQPATNIKICVLTT